MTTSRSLLFPSRDDEVATRKQKFSARLYVLCCRSSCVVCMCKSSARIGRGCKNQANSRRNSKGSEVGLGLLARSLQKVLVMEPIKIKERYTVKTSSSLLSVGRRKKKRNSLIATQSIVMHALTLHLFCDDFCPVHLQVCVFLFFWFLRGGPLAMGSYFRQGLVDSCEVTLNTKRVDLERNFCESFGAKMKKMRVVEK